MKSEKCVFFGNHMVICFYGKPTETERKLGVKILARINAKCKLNGLPMESGKRADGYQAIGSAISNDKLDEGSSKSRRNDLIQEIEQNLDDMKIRVVSATVDGNDGYYTPVFEKGDLSCLLF